jgi:hypothetical protein
MVVFHIVHKDDPRFAFRTVRNARAANFLLAHLGSDYMITEDLCTEIKLSDSVDVFTEHGYKMNEQLRNGDANFC